MTQRADITWYTVGRVMMAPPCQGEAIQYFAVTSTWRCGVFRQKNILRLALGGGRWRALVRRRLRRGLPARVLRRIRGSGRGRVLLSGIRFAGDFFRSPWLGQLVSPRPAPADGGSGCRRSARIVASDRRTGGHSCLRLET